MQSTFIKRLILVILSPVMIFLLVEGAFRLYFTVRGTPAEKFMYLYTGEQIANSNPAFVPLPFVNSGPSPYYGLHNSLGFRGHEIEIERPAGVYRIIATGGSTTYGTGLGEGKSWPEQLEQILRDDYGYTNVEVINTGSVAYTTWNSLVSLEFRELDLQPNLYIVYHGTNDVFILQTPPECYTGKTGIRGLNSGLYRLNGPELPWSVAYRYIAVNRGWIENPAVLGSWTIPYTEMERKCQDLAPLPIDQGIQVNEPIYFERNLRNMIHVARGNNVDVLFSTWAYYPDLVEDGWEQAVEILNTSTTNVAEEMDVHFYDLMKDLPLKREYWQDDGQHQSVEGAREQARLYAAYLDSLGIIPRPGE